MICPECKEKIEYLLEEVKGIKVYKISNGGGYMEWEEWGDGFHEGDTEPHIYCPECNKEFTHDEAEEVVLNEDKLREIVAEKINKNKNKKGKET